MADISQDTYDKGRRIRKILFQQEKGLGDYELNELQDMLLGFIKDSQDNSASYGPVGDGLQVVDSVSANTIVIRRGVYVLQDMIVYLNEDTEVSGLTTPGAPRIDRVFAIINPAEKTQADFPDIINPATSGVQAFRLAYDITFEVSEDHPSDPPTVPVGAVALSLAVLNRTASPTIDPSEIEDARFDYVQSDITSGGLVSHTSGLNYSVEDTFGRVSAVDVFVSGGTFAVPNNATRFIYITGVPALAVAAVYPLGDALVLAKITSEGGVITVVEDLRRFFPKTSLALKVEDHEDRLVIVEDDLTDAHGSQSSLDDRLSETLENDGTLKNDVVGSEQINMLRAYPDDPPSMDVGVNAGVGEFGSSAFSFAGGDVTLSTPSVNPRIDLIYLTPSGLGVLQGDEDPSPVAPSHVGVLPIAEVELETSTTEITAGMIRDVRPFFRDSSSGDAGGLASVGCAAAVEVGHMVYATGELNVDRALADNISTARVVGWVPQKIASEECVISNVGFAPGAGLTPGQLVFLSATTPGAVTGTAPTDPGTYVMPVGVAISSDKFSFILGEMLENT